MRASGRADQTLNGKERLVLGVLVLAALLLGVLVEWRSAFAARRMGDLGVFLRAAWAARLGGERIYSITDDNGWHYVYPPALAILAVPLAEPPPGETGRFLVPYSISVALWYALNLLCLSWAVHALASALDPKLVPRTRRWWVLRVLPLVICIVPAGHTASRGQVNLMLLALLAGWLASMVRGQRFQGGAFLAGAICLKIFPAFLVLVPVLKRDRRCLSGCAAGLFVGLFLLPAVVLGPGQAAQCYVEIYRGVIAPSMNQDATGVCARELTNVTSTDSQSFVSTLHNTIHLDRSTRPRTASLEVRLAHWMLGGLMTLLTILAFRRRGNSFSAGQHELLFGGSLIVCMLLVSPVCHLHYFCLLIPLVLGLVHVTRGTQPYPPTETLLVLAVFLLTQLLPQLPALYVLRDVGLAGYGALLLWAVACRQAVRQQHQSIDQPVLARAA